MFTKYIKQNYTYVYEIQEQPKTIVPRRPKCFYEKFMKGTKK